MYSTLEYAIYGKHPDADTVELLGLSAGLESDVADRWRKLVSLAPLNGGSSENTQAVGIFKSQNDGYLLAHSYPRNQDDETVVFQFTGLPTSVVQMMSGNIRLLLEQTHVTLPTEKATSLDPIELSASPTLASDQRIALLRNLFDQHDADFIFTVLDAALDQRQMVICNFVKDGLQRLQFVQGLILLLPAALRSQMTFSTNVSTMTTNMPRIIFAEDDLETSRRVIDAEAEDWSAPLQSTYARYLQSSWNGDMAEFGAVLRNLDNTATHLVNGSDLLSALALVIQREEFNNIVLSETDEVDNEMLISILSGDTPPPPGDVRNAYVLRLLQYSLDEQDADAVNIISTLMREDNTLDEVVFKHLKDQQQDEPDAVYFFARNHLAGGVDENWIGLLHSSANRALHIAIEDSDTETLMGWLRLIAREPTEYNLGDILQEGIVAAQERTYNDGELGGLLLRFVCRRRPNLIDVLLEDDQLVQALDAPLGPAIRIYEPNSIRESIEVSRELSLVILGRAAQDAPKNQAAAAVMTPSIVEYLWSLHEEDLAHLPGHYQPKMILRSIIHGEALPSNPEIVEVLLEEIATLEDDESDFAREILTVIAGKTDIKDDLIDIVYSNNIAPERVIMMLNQLVESETFTQEDAAEVCLSLSDNLDWPPATLPLAEYIARIIQQDASLTVPLGALWRMLELAGQNQTEFIARVVTRKLTASIESLDELSQIIDLLTRLQEQVKWSSSTMAFVVNWWREYAAEQPISRLQKLDRLLDGKRSLEQARSIVQTTIAIRKMMSNRSIDEFANAIGTAYTVLQAISESFDPDHRANLTFDQTTVRAELNKQEAELAPDEVSILAKNLKELAQLIITMSDHRSKANLIRREEDIERQLLAGEQQPQSAIDTMKWLSGYFTEKLNEES